MFSFIKRLFRELVRKSTYINHGSINKVSIVILILIDIFVLFNVFSGLDNIARWPISPLEEFSCFTYYENYQTSKQKGTFNFDAEIIENVITTGYQSPSIPDVKKASRLGQVSKLCNSAEDLQKKINVKNNFNLKFSINQDRNKISDLNQEVETLQRQYDSTLLEKIAGQSSQKSINKVSAEQVKPKIDANKAQISERKKLIIEKQKRLIQQPASQAYLKLLNNTAQYKVLKEAYRSAQFWYPNKQLLLQTLFLLPLIALAYFVHSLANKRNKDLLALLSWHLLLIFCIPLLVKFFEFIQFGNLIGSLLERLIALLGGLLFIASYLLILIIPLLGFGLIKVLQKFVFNPKIQASKRIQNVRCINCNFKLLTGDGFCPSCGFSQFLDCPNCHQKTYKFTNFCKHCGHQVE
jgi:hypothetical protein